MRSGSIAGLARLDISIARPGAEHDQTVLRALMAVALGVAALSLGLNALSRSYGFDFHGGMWQAGHAVLSGHSPYPPADAALLARTRNAFIPPPLFALIAVPFSLLNWGAAVGLWNLTCLGAMLGALRLVGIRDVRVMIVAVCSFPFVSSLGFGQTEGLLALGLAAGWRWRDSAAGAIAIGLIVAAKLFVWPLAIWLLVTRGVRAGAIAAVTAGTALLLSWAVIGFDGLSGYPGLVLADLHAFRARTHSVTAALIRLGAGATVAQLAAVAIAVLTAGMIVRAGRRSDRALFTAAVAFSLLSSTLLEMHYIALTLIPLAIARPRYNRLWAFAGLIFWVSPQEPPRSVWQIVVVVGSLVLLLLRASRPAQDVSSDRAQPGPRPDPALAVKS